MTELPQGWALSTLGEIGDYLNGRGFKQSVLDDLRRQTHGSGMVDITKGRFEATPVAVPPLAEQRRIVAAIEEHFSRLEAAEASLRRARREIELFRERAVEATLSGDWPWTKLGEIAEIVGGVTKYAKRESDPAFVEVPYLRVAKFSAASSISPTSRR